MDRVVTYFEHEENMVRMERSNRRVWVLCVILIISLLGTNAGWIYYESQWQYTQENTQIEAEQEGSINIIGGGNISYGSESQNK